MASICKIILHLQFLLIDTDFYDTELCIHVVIDFYLNSCSLFL